MTGYTLQELLGITVSEQQQAEIEAVQRICDQIDPIMEQWERISAVLRPTVSEIVTAYTRFTKALQASGIVLAYGIPMHTQRNLPPLRIRPSRRAARRAHSRKAKH